MKKTFLLAAVLLFVTNSFAQLVVDSTGYVSIGTEQTPFSTLSVAGAGRSDSRAYIDARKRYGLYIMGIDTSLDSITGLYAGAKSARITKGIEAIGSSNMASETYGIHSLSGLGTYACGIFGGINGVSTSTSTAGVYGAYYIPTRATFDYPGRYAGYFRGNTLVTGKIYGTVYSLSSASSASTAASSSSIVLTEDTPVMKNLNQIETIQSFRSLVSSVNQEEENSGEVDLSQNELRELEKENSLPEVQYELDAQQLKKFYPDLVQEDAHGNVSVNYIEVVPLLVKGLRELSAELNELKKELGVSREKVKAAGMSGTSEDTDIVRMSQNNPNPFSESSVITLSIPQNAKSANIYVYDLSGKQVKSIPVAERGETNITVYASQLSAGMFIYSLVVDGKVCVTRRMMVEG